MQLILASVAANTLPRIRLFGKVAFITNAADPHERKDFVEQDREALLKKGLDVTEVDLRVYTPETIIDALTPYAIIFVAGGNTFYLLEQMRRSGFYDHAREILKDKTYIGSSAGAVVAGKDVSHVKTLDDPSRAELTDQKGLGLVPYLILPHYQKTNYYEEMSFIIKEFAHEDVRTLTDDEWLEIIDEKTKKYHL